MGQKKDRNQRRHLPGWCGPGRLSWRAPWGPGFSFVSSASFSSNSSSTVSFLNGVWIQSWFPVSVQHRRYYLSQDDLVVVETSELSDQASQARKRKCRWSSTMNPSIHINIGLYYLVGYPPVLRELTWLVTSSGQRLTRNTEQEDVTTL